MLFHIVNRVAPLPDPQLTFRTYDRTPEQCEQLGINAGHELGWCLETHIFSPEAGSSDSPSGAGPKRKLNTTDLGE